MPRPLPIRDLPIRDLGRKAASLLAALACAALAAYAFAYLSGAYRPDNLFDVQFALSGLDVPGHLFGAGLALLLVPLQSSAWIRRRWPRLHRLGGWLSAGAILIGGLSGLSLARHAQGGAASGAGFALLALVWIAVTAVGIGYAVAGDATRHRRWMWRSIALTASALTLRIILGVGTGPLRMDFPPVYVFAAWSCWTFNLAVCETLLRWRRSAPAAAARPGPDPADTRSASGRAGA
ncbi:DUF2306 domain-containing protein [Luteimonas aquatica]|uniref:DUF2306 domain-containing protein n=1 Tax=Luteimonas aquatica TaxID=450364 RepID=UPI001F55D28B|nr:DUF2306 domain-containing protein [Luteimonas aquatica]